MDFGLFTDLLVPLFLVRKSPSVGCERHHGGKVEWVTVQLCISALSAGSQGTVESVAAASGLPLLRDSIHQSHSSHLRLTACIPQMGDRSIKLP